MLSTRLLEPARVIARQRELLNINLNFRKLDGKHDFERCHYRNTTAVHNSTAHTAAAAACCCIQKVRLLLQATDYRLLTRWPPSTFTTEPVMKPPAPLAISSRMPSRSAGWPTLPCGILAITLSPLGPGACSVISSNSSSSSSSVSVCQRLIAVQTADQTLVNNALRLTQKWSKHINSD
eukprot:13431-Heterococcus_DN1.PRE.3